MNNVVFCIQTLPHDNSGFSLPFPDSAELLEVIAEHNWLHPEDPIATMLTSSCKNTFQDGEQLIPVGSIEFVESGLRQWYGIERGLTPLFIPEPLRPFAHRWVQVTHGKQQAESALADLGKAFIKSASVVKCDYSIIYGRQFVKTTKGIIPMILSGSNNCTEFIQGREVLERNWYPMTLSNKDKRIAIPAEELLERARAISTGDGADYEFAKQGGKWLYCKDVLKWVESGIRNAMNIERINFFRPNTPLYGRIVVWRGDKRETVHNCYCKTTQELEAFAEEMESAWKVYGSDKTVSKTYRKSLPPAVVPTMPQSGKKQRVSATSLIPASCRIARSEAIQRGNVLLSSAAASVRQSWHTLRWQGNTGRQEMLSVKWTNPGAITVM